MLTVEELELMDDSAHVTGRAKALERARREIAAATPEQLAPMMIGRCRAKMGTYRRTASIMADALRRFAKDPSATRMQTEYGMISLGTARKEFELARGLNSKAARQLGDWIRKAAPGPTYEHAVARHVTTADGLSAPANTDRGVSAA